MPDQPHPPTRRQLLALAASGALAALAAPQAWGQPAAATGLPATVEAALDAQRIPRDALAAVVADTDARAPLRLAWRAAEPVNTASVAKLITTYAALDILGAAYTWQTPVGFDGPVAAGVLRGNLVIRGSGDPKLVVERLWLLLRRVQAQGVQRIAGDIVLDRSAFQLPPHDPAAFDGEPHRPYNAAPDALFVNHKAITLTLVPDRAAGVARVLAEPPLAGVEITPTVPLADGPCRDWRAALLPRLGDPARITLGGTYASACGELAWPLAPADGPGYAARAIEGLWRAMGGQLDGRVRDGRWPSVLQPAFSAVSPPLAEVVRDINKYSNNPMAEQVFLTLGIQAGGAGTPEAARAAVLRWWDERLPGTPRPVVDNGSGLSRDARASAIGLARLLQHAWASPLMPDLLASLPASGVDGTLRRRTALGAAAHLKTGSLRDVQAVAGYVHAAHGQRRVVVAVVNHPRAADARAAIDALLEWAAR